MSIISSLKRAALALILFVTVYTPAFATVGVLHAGVQIAIPIIIIVSAGVAALIMVIQAGGIKGIVGFGVAMSPPSYLFAAAVAGIVVGCALAYIAALYPAPPPFDVSKLRP